MKRFGIKLAINTLAIIAVASIIPGIYVKGIFSAIAGALLLGVVNTVIRPLLILFTFPLTILTLGVFLFVINGLCFWLAAGLVKNFYITGFFSAFFGALLVSTISLVLNHLFQE